MPKQPKQFKTAFGTYIGGVIIGEGGSGRVYRATDTAGKKVAVKVLDPKKATKEKRKRFKNEILFGFYSKHKGIVRVLDFGLFDQDESDAPFCVMPLYRCTLRAKMKEGIQTDEVLRLFGTLLDGVEAAHLKGVVHRDLKPENIFFDDTDRSLVVGDFGIAHFAEDDLFTLIETMPGTRLANFLYAAPVPSDNHTDAPTTITLTHRWERSGRVVASEKSRCSGGRFSGASHGRSGEEAHGRGLPARQDRTGCYPCRDGAQDRQQVHLVGEAAVGGSDGA